MRRRLTPGPSINHTLPSPNQSTPLSKHPTRSHFLVTVSPPPASLWVPLSVVVGRPTLAISPVQSSSTFGSGSSKKWYFCNQVDGHAEFSSIGCPGPMDSRVLGPRTMGGWGEGRVSRFPLVVRPPVGCFCREKVEKKVEATEDLRRPQNEVE